MLEFLEYMHKLKHKHMHKLSNIMNLKFGSDVVYGFTS